MRPIYTENGFSVRFGSAPAAKGYIRITCTVAHAAGYFEENYLDAPTNNVGSQGGRTATTGVQAVGSAVTYLRRYLLGMVFNIVLADNDDNGESMRRAAPMQRAAATTPRAERKVAPQVYERQAEPAGRNRTGASGCCTSTWPWQTHRARTKWWRSAATPPWATPQPMHRSTSSAGCPSCWPTRSPGLHRMVTRTWTRW